MAGSEREHGKKLGRHRAWRRTRTHGNQPEVPHRGHVSAPLRGRADSPNGHRQWHAETQPGGKPVCPGRFSLLAHLLIGATNRASEPSLWVLGAREQEAVPVCWVAGLLGLAVAVQVGHELALPRLEGLDFRAHFLDRFGVFASQCGSRLLGCIRQFRGHFCVAVTQLHQALVLKLDRFDILGHFLQRCGQVLVPTRIGVGIALFWRLLGRLRSVHDFNEPIALIGFGAASCRTGDEADAECGCPVGFHLELSLGSGNPSRSSIYNSVSSLEASR